MIPKWNFKTCANFHKKVGKKCLPLVDCVTQKTQPSSSSNTSQANQNYCPDRQSLTLVTTSQATLKNATLLTWRLRITIYSFVSQPQTLECIWCEEEKQESVFINKCMRKKYLARSQAFIIVHNRGKLRSILQIAQTFHFS